jgi:hypothetical protein
LAGSREKQSGPKEGVGENENGLQIFLKFSQGLELKIKAF